MTESTYQKPNSFIYGTAKTVAAVFAKAVFKRSFIRNEIKYAKGPFVVIANHQAAYDFVNLIGASKRPMSFVLSNAFYNSLPIKGILDKMGVIPKQQFQTTVSDMRKIKAVISSGNPLVIYPAGLMCEDGLSTPIPKATYKLLQWLEADVYVAKTSGTYFAMPKWGKGFRPGKTYMDIYKLFSKEELAKMDIPEIKEKVDDALLFDAYREQEHFMAKYSKNSIKGLENVLYKCPECGKEFTMEVTEDNIIRCTSCGYEEASDEYSFLHNKGLGREIRYASDWSKKIHEDMLAVLKGNKDYCLSDETEIQMLDYEKHKFVKVGDGTVTFTPENITLTGTVNGESRNVSLRTTHFPILPFTPGKCLELQDGRDIYRCVLKDGRKVMKYIHFVKAMYELNHSDLADHINKHKTENA